MEKLTLRFNLGQEVRTRYRERPIVLREAVLAIESQAGVPVKVRLTARLDASAIKGLDGLLPQPQTVPQGTLPVELSMTPAALAAHTDAFKAANELEDWLRAGDGACLSLDNYALDRQVSRSVDETLDMEFEVD